MWWIIGVISTLRSTTVKTIQMIIDEEAGAATSFALGFDDD
jgi:hypothetical protein